MVVAGMVGAGCAPQPDRSPTVPVEAFEGAGSGGTGPGEVLQEKRIATH